jgi:hypothetical protein
MTKKTTAAAWSVQTEARRVGPLLLLAGGCWPLSVLAGSWTFLMVELCKMSSIVDLEVGER